MHIAYAVRGAESRKTLDEMPDSFTFSQLVFSGIMLFPMSFVVMFTAYMMQCVVEKMIDWIRSLAFDSKQSKLSIKRIERNVDETIKLDHPESVSPAKITGTTNDEPFRMKSEAGRVLREIYIGTPPDC
ncbi:unnamed protein product [Nezara viridula]|uniref:Uncharacterized protein n=1 Tax=Nezara viridula TaxID=85310 RepID=A0A9P0MNS0_NEZVI|nr:unnamed protein product [Nezara viridula]